MSIKLGQRCRIGLLPVDSDTQFFEGTLVAINPPTGCHLIAWKNREPHHFYAWKQTELASKIDHTSIALDGYDKYDYYLWVHENNYLIEEVAAITLRAPPPSNGLFCSECRNHFPYAQSNQPNGELICYSCRKYPFYGSKVD